MHGTLIIGQLSPPHSAVCEYCFDCPWPTVLPYTFWITLSISAKPSLGKIWINLSFTIYICLFTRKSHSKHTSVLMCLLFRFLTQVTSPILGVHLPNLRSWQKHIAINRLQTWFGFTSVRVRVLFLARMQPHTTFRCLFCPVSLGLWQFLLFLVFIMTLAVFSTGQASWRTAPAWGVSAFYLVILLGLQHCGKDTMGLEWLSHHIVPELGYSHGVAGAVN